MKVHDTFKLEKSLGSNEIINNLFIVENLMKCDNEGLIKQKFKIKKTQ